MALAIEPPPIDYSRWDEGNVVFSERESEFAGAYNRNQFPTRSCVRCRRTIPTVPSR